MLTVATLDYVPQALGMFARLREVDPSVVPYLFVVDADPSTNGALKDAFAEEWDWVNWFAPSDLSAHRDAFQTAFDYYNGIEISCFAKYVALYHLLLTLDEPVLFLDADVVVVAALGQILLELGDRALLLTPHAMGSSEPSMEHEYLMHGWVNAGFVMAKATAEALRILDWLIDRIAQRGYLAPEYGMSCDQTWVSALPFSFHDDVVLSRNPGLNVAYWNLHERALGRLGETLTVNKRPLVFFHFSGFSVDRPDMLSRHFLLAIEPDSIVSELSRKYVSQLAIASQIGTALSGMPRRRYSDAPLRERLAAGTALHGINLRSPTVVPGLLTKIAARIEAALAKRRI